MNSPARPTFKVFETRESEEYKDILSTVLSIENSSSPIYQDLVSSSFGLSPDASDKMGQSHNLKINRVINIDYVGMTAAVLLDRELRHTQNAHYGRLNELLKSLGDLNERGVAVKIRIVLQYPYSLAGQNRILSEMWNDRAYMGEAHGRDETELAPALTLPMIEHSSLIRAQQYCLENLQSLRERLEISEPNKLEIRFAFISTLICGLRVNNLFFYDPYHYGRVRGTNTCAYTSNPVVMIDGSDRSSAYQAFCNHFRVIWECDSTLGYDDVIEIPKGMGAVIIKRPEKLDPTNKAKRLKELGSFDDAWEKKRKGQLYRLVNRLCPIIRPVDEPEWGFLAAAWEQKRDGNHGPCIPALILAEMFSDAFPSLDRDVRVSVLQTDLGESLSRTLFGLMDASTFSIILLTKEIEGKYCKPNVYFELGYLFNKNRTRRTLIVVEEGMHFPTDLSDVISTHIRRSNPQSIDEMKRVFRKLLENMERANIINENTLKELLEDWLPRWQPSANLLREITNYFEK
jgi:hypothetical protein